MTPGDLQAAVERALWAWTGRLLMCAAMIYLAVKAAPYVRDLALLVLGVLLDLLGLR